MGKNVAFRNIRIEYQMKHLITHFCCFLYRSLLLAACEKKSILMFDPLCRKLVRAIDNAHNDCVNCVRLVELA